MTLPLNSFLHFNWPDDLPHMEEFYDAYAKDKSQVPCADNTIYDPDLWFKDDGVEEAKKLCWDCPARKPCLFEALTSPAVGDWGVFGGATWDERLAMRRGIISPFDIELARDVSEDHPFRPRCLCAKCRVRSASEKVASWRSNSKNNSKRAKRNESRLATSESSGMEDVFDDA